MDSDTQLALVNKLPMDSDTQLALLRQGHPENETFLLFPFLKFV